VSSEATRARRREHLLVTDGQPERHRDDERCQDFGFEQKRIKVNNMINDNFIYIHVRPGLFKKGHPVATIAVNVISDSDSSSADGIQRYAVGFAAQHTKKDTQWNAAMGRNVARGRAERSADRVFVLAKENVKRRELIELATARVLEAVDAGDIFASKKTTKALRETLGRFKLDSKKSYNNDEVLEEVLITPSSLV